MSKSLKVEWNKINKKIEFPKSFEDLINTSTKWINYDTEALELIFKDAKSDLIISDESSFKQYQNIVVGTGKVIAQTREKQIKEENINNNIQNQIIDNINQINSININEDLDISQLKDDIKKIVSQNTKIIKEKLMTEIINKIKTQSNINKPNQQLTIHEGIACSQCNKCPIKGKRYKCIKCKDINLCEECENKKQHDIYHILLQISNPINDDILNNIAIPILIININGTI